MNRRMLREAFDVRSTWTLWILIGLGLAVTSVLALTRSPRMPWAALSTLLLILLNGINHLRILWRLKSLHGRALRRKETHGE